MAIPSSAIGTILPTVTAMVERGRLAFFAEAIDVETGLVYLRARYYAPMSGEFTSTDPLVSQTLAATRYASNDPLNVLDLLGLDDWYNPSTWGAKSWAIAGTVALAIGGVALAFTGVGLIADAAVIGPGAAEASAATLETVAAAGAAADAIGVTTGSVATAIDWGACTIHKDNEACGGAIINTVGLGFGAGGLATAASKYGTEGLALGASAHGFAYSAGGYALDWDSHNREEEYPCSVGASNLAETNTNREEVVEVATARRLNNPVVVAIILHGMFFVILLFGLTLEVRAAGPNATAAIPINVTATFALVIVVMSISITYSILRRRGRRNTVAELNPRASIVSAAWNGGVSAPFLRRGPARNATTFRAVGVEIVADERGIAIWRGGPTRWISASCHGRKSSQSRLSRDV